MDLHQQLGIAHFSRIYEGRNPPLPEIDHVLFITHHLAVGIVQNFFQYRRLL